MTRSILIAALATAGITAVQQSASAQNPVISGFQTSSQSYDPFSDHLVIDDDQQRTRASYYDSNRHVIDPGSYRRVDRYIRDQSGRLVHEHGVQWTSNGIPHGRLTRDQTTHYPSFVQSPPFGRPFTSPPVYYPSRPTVTHHQSGTVHYGPSPSVTHHQSGTMHYGSSPSVTHNQRETHYYSRKR